MFTSIRWTRYISYAAESDTVICTWSLHGFGRSASVSFGRPLRVDEPKPHDTLDPELCWCGPMEVMGITVHRDETVPMGRVMILGAGQTWVGDPDRRS
jgi:hypothetical protein